MSEELAPGWVRIVHEELKLESTVLEGTVPAWETAGWTRADNGSEESEQKQPPPLPPQLSGLSGNKNEE